MTIYPLTFTATLTNDDGDPTNNSATVPVVVSRQQFGPFIRR